MNNSPLVSILVPVYGVEKYIERCARSLFEQTYENLEYIFVDDCSPDNSIAILGHVLDSFPHRLPQVRIIKHAQNEGLAAVRNTTINNATGDFVYFLDSDDYIETDTIAALVDLQRQTNADVVTGQKYVNNDEIDFHYIEPVYKNKDEMLMSILSNVWHHEITDRLILRSLFVNNCIEVTPHINICEDWLLTAKVVYYADNCVTADKFTYHYTFNPNSLVHSITEWGKWRDANKQERLALQELIALFEGTKYEEAVYSLYLRRLSRSIDMGIIKHDKEFFKQCQYHILSTPSKYQQSLSKAKLFSIKNGYYMTSFFFYLHQIKQRLS